MDEDFEKFTIKKKKYHDRTEFQVRPVGLKIGVNSIDVVVGRGGSERDALIDASQNIEMSIEFLKRVEHDIRVKL